jgi:hypothetical protein
MMISKVFELVTILHEKLGVLVKFYASVREEKDSNRSRYSGCTAKSLSQPLS